MNKKEFLMELASKAKFICKQGRRNPRYIYDSSRELITVLKYVSIGGHLLPSIIVTKGAYYYFDNYIRGQSMLGSIYRYLSKS